MRSFLVSLALCMSVFGGYAQHRVNLEDHINNMIKKTETLQGVPLKVYLNGQVVEKLSEHELELDNMRMRIELTDDGDQEKDLVVIRVTGKAYRIEPNIETETTP